MPSTTERARAMQAEIERSHRALGELTDAAKVQARAVYERGAVKLGEHVTDELRASMRLALDKVVQDARVEAHKRGASDVVRELAAAFPAMDGFTLDGGPAPDKKDVREYVLNAVDIALELVRDAIEEGDDETRELLVEQGWRGERVVVSETVRTYNDTRMRAYDDIARKHDDGSFGFELLKDEDELPGGERAVDGDEEEPSATKPSKEPHRDVTVVLALRWGALLDKRTCLRCRELDGRFTILALPFVGPPLHTNCRCVTALWPIPWTWEDE